MLSSFMVINFDQLQVSNVMANSVFSDDFIDVSDPSCVKSPGLNKYRITANLVMKTTVPPSNADNITAIFEESADDSSNWKLEGFSTGYGKTRC